MLALAIVEHLLLVMPFPSTGLWRWALRQGVNPSRTAAPPQVKRPLEKHDDLLRAR
jgi:hypothetical protein